jgi:putative tryptophan/tyrosine transport system substrate-binding protein
MRRREFISALGSAVFACPSMAMAQRAEQVRRVAWLGLGHPDPQSPYVESLRAGLRDNGWIEGQNLSLALYWATGRDDMEAAARSLLATNPEVVVTQELMTYALRATKTGKPVVFGFSGDPVDGKLVESLATPGGNFTGMSYLAIELVGKRIELLKEWLPRIRHIGVLARPQHPGDHLERQASEAVARRLGIEFSYFPYQAPSLPARDLGELEQAFGKILGDGCDALVVFPDSAMYEICDRVAGLAIKAKLPTVSGWTPFARAGLLMTYGPDIRELYRSLGRYVDRILRGAKPAELPVERPTKLNLAINLKTAKALDVIVPAALLSRADEVIE